MDVPWELSDIDLTRMADATGRLIALRGGCRCRTGQPCRACMDPMTALEAAMLGLATSYADGERQLRLKSGDEHL